MTDILTKEERETVERARLKIREDEAFDNPHTLESELLAIIDNLSMRGVKKYSEDELRSEFENGHVDVRRDGWSYVDLGMTNSWHGFYRCAQFLGTLEEKQ